MITAVLKADKDGFGFCVEDESPCRVNVLPNGVAYLNGMRTGDVLIAINNINVERLSHYKVANIFGKMMKRKEAIITFHRQQMLPRTCNEQNMNISTASLASTIALPKNLNVNSVHSTGRARGASMAVVHTNTAFKISKANYLEMHSSRIEETPTGFCSTTDEEAVRELRQGAWLYAPWTSTTAAKEQHKQQLQHQQHQYLLRSRNWKSASSEIASSQSQIVLRSSAETREKSAELATKNIISSNLRSRGTRDDHRLLVLAADHRRQQKQIEQQAEQQIRLEDEKRFLLNDKENRINGSQLPQRVKRLSASSREEEDEEKRKKNNNNRIKKRQTPRKQQRTTKQVKAESSIAASAKSYLISSKQQLKYCKRRLSAARNDGRAPAAPAMLQHQQQHQQHTASTTAAAAAGDGGRGSGAGASSGSFTLDKTDIEQVLKSETARAPFQQFLQQQFCSENINFYLAVEEYRLIPDSKPDLRAEFGRQIFERHFAPNCIEPVNIDNSTANSIREAYKQNKFTSDLYDVVQYQIFHLLKYDCWPRYLRAGGQIAEELGGTAASTFAKHAGSISEASNRDALTKQQQRGGSRRKSLFRFLRDRLNATHDGQKESGFVDSASIDFTVGGFSSLSYTTRQRPACSSFCTSSRYDSTAQKYGDDNVPRQVLASSRSSFCIFFDDTKYAHNATPSAAELYGGGEMNALLTSKYCTLCKMNNTSKYCTLCAKSNGVAFSDSGCSSNSGGGGACCFCNICYGASCALCNSGGTSATGARPPSIHKSATVACSMAKCGVLPDCRSDEQIRTPRTRHETTNFEATTQCAAISPTNSDVARDSSSLLTMNDANSSPNEGAGIILCPECTEVDEKARIYDETPVNFSFSASELAGLLKCDNCAKQVPCRCDELVSRSSCCHSPLTDDKCQSIATSPMPAGIVDSCEEETKLNGFSQPLSPSRLLNLRSSCRNALSSIGRTPSATRLIASTSYQPCSQKQQQQAEELMKNNGKRRHSMAAWGRRLSAGFLVRKIAATDDAMNVTSSAANSVFENRSICQCQRLPPLVLTPEMKMATADARSRRSVSCSPRTRCAVLTHQERVGKNELNSLVKQNQAFGETGGQSGSHQHNRQSALREPPADVPVKTCTLLSAECVSSTEISLVDQLQSVKQWAAQMAESCGLDKNASEVVDAQTGATIDPARQAVDALNNRTVRLMAVVWFPVIFLAPSPPNAASPSKSPLPAKVVILRARSSLTVNKVLTPMMLKYNVSPSEAVVCFAGTVDVVERQTPVGAFCPRPLTVLTHVQYVERKAMTKRDYQKELNIVPLWLCALGPSTSSLGAATTTTAVAAAPNATSSSASAASASNALGGLTDASSLIFHQHGDVGFFEMPLEAESGKSLKHNATRSYSSNPKEFFKFGRKPSQAKSARGAGLGSGIAGAFNASGSSSAVPPDYDHATVTTATVASVAGGGGDLLRQHHHAKLTGGSSFGLTDRRKSLGATAIGGGHSSSAGSSGASISMVGSSSVGNSYKMGTGGGKMARSTPQVEKSDIPYCGDEPLAASSATISMDVDPITSTATAENAAMSKKDRDASSASGGGGIAPPRFLHHHAYCYEMPEFLKTDTSSAPNVQKTGANGATAHLPAIYTSKVRSDKETAVTPAEVIEDGLEWQKADYV